jgi:hypothetical protein
MSADASNTPLPGAVGRPVTCVYEYREYHIQPGKMADILLQFTTLIPPFFEKHGIEIVGAWEQLIGENDRYVYLLKWDDLAHRERAMNGLWADPQWLAAFGKWKEERGPATRRIVNKIWKPTTFSPMQ